MELVCFLQLIGAEAGLKHRHTDNNKVTLFNVCIDSLKREAVLKWVDDLIITARARGQYQYNEPQLLVTLDSIAMMRAQNDHEYLHIINDAAALVLPDGMGLICAANLLGQPLYERIAGIDILKEICALAEERGYRVYLLGAKEGIAAEAARSLHKLYPGLDIVGWHHGHFEQIPGEEEAVIREIASLKPDVLFAGLGMPRQEKWLYRNLEKLAVPVSMGVGGSLDVLAGMLPRAPAWAREYGMEWLFRLLREPTRARRMIALPRFAWLVLKSKLTLSKRLGRGIG